MQNLSLMHLLKKPLMKGRYAPLLIVLLTLSLQAFSQDDLSGPAWRKTESGIYNKDHLGDISDQLNRIQQQARAAHDIPTLTRCLRDQMLIADQRSEDTLFFKNSLFIDSILNDSQSSPLLRSILFLLKADRIATYADRFSYKRNKNLIDSYTPGTDYSKLTLSSLYSLIDDCFEQAKKISRSLDTVPIAKLLWLSHNPLVFLFKPDLTDIIYSEQIAFLSDYSSSGTNQGLQQWLSFSQDDFMRILDTTTWFPGIQQPVFRLYKDWIHYHLPSSPDAAFFIETIARKYLYGAFGADSTASAQYEQYLQTLTRSPFAAVRAHGVYQLCLRWNEEARKYTPNATGVFDYGPINSRNFDSAYRGYYNKVLTAIEDHRQLMDSFPLFGNILQREKADIIAPAFHINGQDSHLPDAPILAFLKYRNCRALHIRVIRVNINDEFIMDGTIQNGRKTGLSRLLSLTAYRETVQPLPAGDDHQWHNAFLKIDALPAGHYTLLFSDTLPSEKDSRIDYMPITVTNIAVINNDQRVFVLNRRTGYPIAGAMVITEYKRQKNAAGAANYTIRKQRPPAVINADGYTTIGEPDADRLKVFTADDTVDIPFHQGSASLPDGFYDKEDNANLMDYYEQNIQLHMFTDRSIYRPGQTVHYKGIFMIRNPHTGEFLVLNWKNLRFPFFKKLLYRLSAKFSQQKLEVYINDPFDKTMDTVKVIPNRYGSFAGAFTLPKEAATGQWSFDFEYQSGRIDGSFKVEEYRRPSFELKLDKPKNELYLGDNFNIKASTNSYAGAALGHVELRYKITAHGSLPRRDGKPGPANEYRAEPVDSGQAYTNDQGMLIITVRDTALDRYRFPDDRKWEMDYTIEAEAIDATGESHSESLEVGLSSRPVRFTLSFPRVMEQRDLVPLYIPAGSDLAGPVKKRVELRLYRLPPEKLTPQNDVWPATDVSLYSKEDLRHWLGGVLPENNAGPGDTEPGTKDRQLIFQDSLMAGEDKFNWPKQLMTSGRYTLEITCREHGKITGSAQKEFSLFDRTANTLPGETASFEYMQSNQVKTGGRIHWTTGNSVQDIFSIYHLAYYTRTAKGVKIKYSYGIRPEKKGLNEWEYTIPEQAIGTVLLTHLYIFNDRLYKQEETLSSPETGVPKPQIIIERYRKKLEPGGQETFQLSVRSGDKNQAAEIMTTLYDASLDKLEPHAWTIPNTLNDFQISNNWDDKISSPAEAQWQPESALRSPVDPQQEKTLWWLDPADYPYIFRDRPDNSIDPDGSNILFLHSDRLKTMNLTGLDDVVVIGYGTQKRNVTGAVITIRGAASLNDYGKILVILDGVPYTGDLRNLDANSITQGLVLKGADATSLYGTAAANGVLLLSTKGPVQIPQMNEPQPVAVRRNFAETAFFYGQLHAGRKGIYSIPFTLPESVTEWKWKIFAHTKAAVFAYEERTLYSQLPLMVQPDMPRFLYQGDTTLLTSRITNADSAAHKGSLQCRIEDALTGQDLTEKLVVAGSQTGYQTGSQGFSVLARSTANGSFRIAIPAGLLHPLRIKIIASADRFSDGEEHILPILAKKILVARNTPIVFHHQKEAKIEAPVLPADAEPYGIALYIDPQPQAAMINALPWLANYPYDCAEQTFNKLLAHALAIRIARKDSTALTLSRQKVSRVSPATSATTPAAKDQPGLPDEQSMPWLHLANQAANQQAALNKLLDTMRGHLQIEKYFTDLRQMQNSDGGVCWFKGGRSDLFISEYLLAGFGKMKKDSLPLPSDADHFIAGLIAYCDRESAGPGANQPGYFYARSFWIKEFPVAPAVAARLDGFLREYWEKDKEGPVGHQASMISATLRYATPGQPFYQAAILRLGSIRQSAITDTVNGIRWKEISDPDDLNTRTEEWLVRIAEAFEQDGQSGTTVTGIVKWLLQSRQDHHWGTTKSTADAVSLLNMQRPSVIGHPASWQLQSPSAALQVTNNLLGGQPFAFSSISGAFPRELTIRSEEAAPTPSSGNSTPSSGGVNYYYFSADPNEGESPTGKGVKISKKLYRQNEKTAQWEPITATTSLKIADKIKTVLTIDAPRQLQYVFIDEKRAAALEPADPESRYVYGDDIEYYRSVRDIGIQFFAEKIPSGISTISYESVVDREGSYLDGAAALQCMYQPSVKAYSNTRTLKIVPADTSR
jgi:alpha-2-macroglobulin